MDPLHITEFASERYFSKLRQLDGQAEPAAATASSTTNVPELPAALRAPTFTLPLRRQRSAESDNAAPALRPSDQKKRSLGHDLTPLRTQRRPILGGGLGALRSKISVTQKPISVGEHQQAILAADPTAATSLNLSELFLTLPAELQAQIIAPLPIHAVLNLRLVSKTFHALVTLNESPIARYHIANSLPKYTLKLYPVPDPQFINLHYLCGIWHRLQVALKLSTMITQQATKELFSRTTEAARLEFEPQSQRMCKRLTPLVFALFHFFETYRDLHVKHLTYGGVPLRMQAFTLNPIETQVMAMYDDHTLLKVHQVFPLILSSISRRLRPPSYAGRIERSIKGYLKDRPADEVYSSIVLVGGLRQAQRFWEKKGYNIRREAVDVWYSYITKTPVEAPPPKSKMARLATFGRKKTQPVVDTSSSEKIGHESETCKEWFCVKSACLAARRRHSTDNLVFHSSLAAGPPMGPLTREQLRQLLPDQQDLKNIWVLTAEALILQRKIVSRPQDIKRNHMVLLELIGPDGPEVDEFTPAPPREGDALQQEGMGGDGGVSD
ncbi:hypothetical protein GLAREA_02790 [Glarea lozoyensis ATCC 20868]|uniref:F-box domain-containing protein n=1 Tax=Glarea lozoyensis (strain ATCC 20868 / MF5171) TaxID=1116229 RepID=S3D490_GLAL2|nr:uncharacterized protein GLAREA_02790 [Glarea lozoyensis ATCC 20868]EPE26876.1 hypothetical protein GLAREA_02790 [Glarea lozoyensis ATCC 20868]